MSSGTTNGDEGGHLVSPLLPGLLEKGTSRQCGLLQTGEAMSPGWGKPPQLLSQGAAFWQNECHRQAEGWDGPLTGARADPGGFRLGATGQPSSSVFSTVVKCLHSGCRRAVSPHGLLHYLSPGRTPAFWRTQNLNEFSLCRFRPS